MPAPINYDKKRLENAYNKLYKNNNNNANKNNKNNNNNSNSDNSYVVFHSVEYSCYHNDVSIADSKCNTRSK